MKLAASRSYQSAAELDYDNHPDDHKIELAPDGKPFDYVDETGTQWVMAACGHRVGGGVKVGQKINLCPNCRFLMGFQDVPIVYPERANIETIQVLKED